MGHPHYLPAKSCTECGRNIVDDYRLTAKVVSLGMVTKELPDLRRYRIVIIDESHNLRNRDTQRYRAVHDYISTNESRCILLSATPYNKSYLDLSAQLRLFIDENKALRSPTGTILENDRRSAIPAAVPSQPAFNHRL